jgi:hypothetical protein
MAYVDPDFKTKAEFKEAVKAGDILEPYNPSGLFPVSREGAITIEGPHYPKPHKWYARCEVRGGRIVKVIS